MDTPQKHVVENVAAGDLPDRLRGGIAPSATVRVTVEVAGRDAESAGRPSRWARFAAEAAASDALRGKSDRFVAELRAFRDAAARPRYF
jgi:hypothetical protein